MVTHAGTATTATATAARAHADPAEPAAWQGHAVCGAHIRTLRAAYQAGDRGRAEDIFAALVTASAGLRARVIWKALLTVQVLSPTLREQIRADLEQEVLLLWWKELARGRDPSPEQYCWRACQLLCWDACIRYMAQAGYWHASAARRMTRLEADGGEGQPLTRRPRAWRTLSLERVLRAPGLPGGATPDDDVALSDILADPRVERALDRAEYADLRAAVDATLDERERRLVRLFYAHDWKPRKVAAALGIGDRHTRWLRRQLLRKLRTLDVVQAYRTAEGA